MKTKRLIAFGLIFIGLIGLAIAFAPLLGLMSITPAAFEDYPTEFDPANASVECTGESPEFEPTTQDFITTNGSIFFESQKPRTICGINSENAVYSPYTNTMTFQNYEAGKELIGYPQATTTFTTAKSVIGFVATENGSIGEPCWLGNNGEIIGEINGTITKIYSKEYESQASTIQQERWCPASSNQTRVVLGFNSSWSWDGSCHCTSGAYRATWGCNQYCGSVGSSFLFIEGGYLAWSPPDQMWCVRTLGEPAQKETIKVMECVYPKTITVPANTPLTVQTNQTQRGGITELLLPAGATTTQNITFTIPRSTIPNELHYREYSCPLESGRYLTAQTFIEHETISANTFAYEPNYFCSRHGIIQTQLATQRSIETTEEYKQIVSGQTVTVPAGDTWTFFYVPKINVNLPIKCEEGDYYDVETEKCVKLIGGFIYVCTDPETNLIGNQCVKEADLKIICPINSDLIEGKCYIAGEIIMTCPEGYTKIANKCYQEGETVTTCPTGYELRNDACYIQGTNIIECPTNYALIDGKCYTNGSTVTTCPTGYELRNNACYIEGKNIIECPTGYTLRNSQCFKIGSLITTCPTGYSLMDGGCYKEGETFIVCPTGYLLEDGKCLQQGSLITTCPTGYDLINGGCYQQGTLITTCPTGYDLRSGACYIQGTNTIECPTNYTLIGDKCFVTGETITTCPTGYALRDNKCYKTGVQITTCPTGYTLKDGACWIVGTQNMVCPDGTHKATIDGEEKCIIDSTYCPDGYTRQDDKCVKGGEIICPSGTIKIGDNCQRTETVCPEGSIEINNACVREGEIVCPEGTTMNEAKQCVQEPLELPDINYLSAGIGTISMILGAIILRF